MRYTFSQHLLLRMPVKNPTDHSADRQSFLNDLHFRSALYLASPIFYATLGRNVFAASKLAEKETTTLQKYINRYCFRPTPFGLFSSVTLLNWVAGEENHNLTPEFTAHFSTAMTTQNLLSQRLLENELRHQATFKPNPSIYRLLNEYRFFRTSVDEQSNRRDYQLQSIAFSKLLKDLITSCSRGCSRQAVVNQIRHAAACTQEEAEDYTDFLIDSQLLVNSLRLNITGPDPLSTLIEKLDEGPMKADLSAILNLQKDNRLHTSPVLIKILESRLNPLLIQSLGKPGLFNVILQRNRPDEVPALHYQQHLREGLKALELLSPSGQLATLSQFIKGFQQHFEGQTLPLLQALDPEAGIGYQQPETEKNNLLLETLHLPYKTQPGPTGNWSAVHSLLLEAWLRDRSADPMIRLDDNDLEKLERIPSSIMGMSILFRIAEDKIFMENAGGINAPALMGRFTAVDEKIANAAQQMARELENQNPDVIFAELLHLADPHTDNVNRRAHIYQYELPLTAASTLPETRQIQLADLYVKVIDGLVMLFSEKHQKFVIPRLTSAYNHSLNKLPLFRFLADLPYQHGRSGLGLDLRALFPNLHFYPRVEYKNTILSLATWIINEKQITAMSRDYQERAFDQTSDEIRLTRYFSLAEGDQELVFDQQSPQDVRFFCACIRQKKEVILKEFLSQPIIRQYNAYLMPADPIHLPQLNPPARKVKVIRRLMPGSEWLYLKVYAPKIGVSRLLLSLKPLLSRSYGDHRIIQWFFIRYEDHAPHIRLRLQVSPEAISNVLVAFKTKLEDRIQQHVIREFQIDVYSRELERYVAGGIENTERFFWAGSELVLSFLKQGKTQYTTHAFALYSTYAIVAEFVKDPDETILFTFSSYQQFLPEFADKSFKVELDKKYRELTPEIMAAFNKADPGVLSGSIRSGLNFKKSLQIIGEVSTGQADRTGYLRSIIHMHLNRIFTDESRKQEMICYYLLHKYLLSVKGRNKKNPLIKTISGRF